MRIITATEERAEGKKVLAAMPDNLCEMIGSVNGHWRSFGVTLKTIAPEDSYVLAYDIADAIEAAVGQKCRISVYRPRGGYQEIVYQRFLPGELKSSLATR